MEKTIIKQNGNNKVNMEKVFRTIEKLENNEEWVIYIEIVAEKLDKLIEMTKQELKRETNTASLRFTGITKTLKEKVEYFAKTTFDDNEIPELLKVVNHFLKGYELYIHPLPGKGIFVSRLVNNNKSKLVEEIEIEFRKRISNK
jgi:hypothetical protein